MIRGASTDIIHTCLLTILACIWITIHPNIPRDTKWMTAILQRVTLALYTFVLPEVVVFWAVKQWKVAGHYATKYKDRGWTRTHGFFLIMGGFVVCEDSTEPERYQTVSPEEFDDMVVQGSIAFPCVTKAELEDRSKGDALTKGAVIIQNLWFVAQCVGRVHQGLTITELELVTLGFTALNGMIYFFWVDKPLDVKCPIVLRRMVKVDKAVYVNHEKGTSGDNDSMVKMESLTSSSARSLGESKTTECITDDKLAHPSRSLTMAFNQPAAIILCILSFPTGIIVVVAIFTIFQKVYFGPLQSMDETMLISSRLLSPENNVNRATFTSFTNTKMPTLYASHESFLKKSTISAVCGLAGFLVGILHCVGWNSAFPSQLEKMAWRLSAAWLAGLPVVYASLMIVLASRYVSENVLFVQPSVRVHRGEEGWKVRVKWNGSVWMLIVCMGMMVWDYSVNLLYMLSRLYTIVGALCALRELEHGALMDVIWTRYIPHV